MNDLQSLVRDNWKTILCEANSRLDKVNFRLSSVYEQIFPYKSIPISLSILYVVVTYRPIIYITKVTNMSLT